MEKEFIPYEQALALKELGFDESCIKYYWTDGMFTKTYESPFNHNKRDNSISAPLYQQAFRWFREKYNINYAMKPILGSKNGYDSFPILGWDYDIFITNKDTWNSFYMGYPVGEWFTATLDNFDEGETLSDLNINPTTYDKAELECLKKLIELVNG